MIHKIFTVYDEKAKAFMPPFFLPETGMAVRVFTDCVNDPTHQFYKHPADYNLYDIGTFDDSCAKLTETSPRNLLGAGVMFKTDSPTQNGDLFPDPVDMPIIDPDQME